MNNFATNSVKGYSSKANARRAAKSAGIAADDIVTVEVDGLHHFFSGQAASETADKRASGVTLDGVRRTSDMKGACRQVWQIADDYVAEHGQAVRKDILQQCDVQGIAYHTARTQYQLWKAATDASNNTEA